MRNGLNSGSAHGSDRTTHAPIRLTEVDATKQLRWSVDSCTLHETYVDRSKELNNLPYHLRVTAPLMRNFVDDIMGNWEWWELYGAKPTEYIWVMGYENHCRDCLFFSFFFFFSEEIWDLSGYIWFSVFSYFLDFYGIGVSILWRT